MQESFGFDFAEDQAENTDLTILGERRLKEEFIRSYKPARSVILSSRGSRTPPSRRCRRRSC